MQIHIHFIVTIIEMKSDQRLRLNSSSKYHNLSYYIYTLHHNYPSIISFRRIFQFSNEQPSLRRTMNRHPSSQEA